MRNSPALWQRLGNGAEISLSADDREQCVSDLRVRHGHGVRRSDESESGAKKFALVYSLAVGIPTASILGAILGHYPKNGVRIAHWDDLSGEEGDSGA